MSETNMATPKKIPQKNLKFWGADSILAIQALIDGVREREFFGPISWQSPGSISFLHDASDNIRIMLSVGRCGMEFGYGLFDSSLVVLSKTIFENTLPSDPWGRLLSDDEPWQNGFVPCLATSLAHLKWAESVGTKNPVWRMTTNPEVESNIFSWFADFDRLLWPTIARLKSDADLHRQLSAAINYRRPDWVKSTGPNFVFLRERLAALSR
jgi:hypothetical protein